MKKFILLLGICSFATGITAFSQAKIGIKGGLNLANITATNNGETNTNNVLTTFNAGIYIDAPLAPGFAFQPGLMLEGKGEKIHYSNPDYTIRVNPIYLEIPANFVGKVPIGPGSHLLLGAGPYAAFGVAGKVRENGTFLGSNVDNTSNIQWDNDTPFNNSDKDQGYGKLKRFDYGINFLAGFQFDNVTLTANYGLGLAKINSGSNNTSNDKNKNRVVSISLGFLFK